MKSPVSITVSNFFLLLYLLPFTVVNCRRYCYSCATKDNDMTCLTNPQNVTEGPVIVECQHFCTISRIEYVYSEILIFINRSCETTAVDSIGMDNYFIIYNRSCNKNLCNVGDGKESLRHLIVDDVEEEEPDPEEMSSSVAIKPFFQKLPFLHNTFCFILFSLFFSCFLQNL